MRTLEVKDVTTLWYEKKLEKNRRLKKWYGEKEALSCGWYIKESYLRMFSITFEHNDGVIEEELFGIPLYSDSPTMFGGEIQYDVEEEIKEKIITFCKEYGQRIRKGDDIQDIINDDPLNILEYDFNIKNKEKNKLFVKRKSYWTDE